MSKAHDINWDLLSDDFLDSICQTDDLDQALAPLMNLVDPNNQHDLGGCAGMFFSAPAEYTEDGNFITANRFWVIAPPKARRGEVDDLIDFMKIVTAEPQ